VASSVIDIATTKRTTDRVMKMCPHRSVKPGAYLQAHACPRWQAVLDSSLPRRGPATTQIGAANSSPARAFSGMVRSVSG
jgi:hypothetical protein